MEIRVLGTQKPKDHDCRSQNTLILVCSCVFFTSLEEAAPAYLKESLRVTAKKVKIKLKKTNHFIKKYILQ